MNSAIVTEDDLERELAFVRDTCREPALGLFGEVSMVWRVAREQIIFLGAGRALLLQLAHPWVARGISEHSTTLADPIQRLHRTFNVMFTMVFGTSDQALDVARRLYRRHAGVTGQLTDVVGQFAGGSRYWANEVSALRWVHATLLDTTLASYELVLPPLTACQREQYYREWKLLARLFAIPQEQLPETWADFCAYREAMWDSDTLSVGADARAIAHGLLEGGAVWLSAPSWYRAITARLLPAKFREAFGLSFDDSERHRAETALTRVRQTYAFLPERLRHVSPYLEAKARLSGKSKPDMLTRIGNMALIGRSRIGN